SEAVIVALINRDKTIFTLSAEDLVALKKDGISETILIMMLRSGRDDVPPPPPMEMYPPQEPPIVIPQEPPRHEPPPPQVYAVPYIVPVVVPVPVVSRAHRVHRQEVVTEPFVPHHQQSVIPQQPMQAPVLQPHTFTPTQGIFFQGTPRGIFFNR